VREPADLTVDDGLGEKAGAVCTRDISFSLTLQGHRISPPILVLLFLLQYF